MKQIFRKKIPTKGCTQNKNNSCTGNLPEKILASQNTPTLNFSNSLSLKFSLTTITRQTVHVIQNSASTFLAGSIYLGASGLCQALWGK